MDYNSQLPHLIIPEYGRNIQRMIDHCCSIEDKDERNKCARAIIQIMGQLNPHLRDVPDFAHKLWDHLFVISRFRLDVDSPYPKPSAETLETKPELVAYPTGKMKYRSYGKTIEDIIEKACQFEEGPQKEDLKRMIANYLKKSYVAWNKDNVPDDIILNHLNELSEGKLKMEESAAPLAQVQEFKQRTNNAQRGKHHHHKHKGNNQNRNFKRKY